MDCVFIVKVALTIGCKCFWHACSVLETKYLQKVIDFRVGHLYPSNHLNVVLSLLSGWYDPVTSENVKSTSKQRCVCQRWNLQCWATSIPIFFVNSIRQRRNNVIMFSIELQNTGQHRNNVVNMTICKKSKNKPGVMNKIIFLSCKLKSQNTDVLYTILKFSSLYPHFKRKM